MIIIYIYYICTETVLYNLYNVSLMGSIVNAMLLNQAGFNWKYSCSLSYIV